MAAKTTPQASVASLPGEIDETFPDVFNINGMPKQPLEKKPGQLPDDMIKQFFEEGYVVVESFFKKEELDACRDSIDKLVDDLANMLYTGKKIKNLYKEYGLFERLTHIEKEFPGANILLHKQGQLTQISYRSKVMDTDDMCVACRPSKTWSNPRLLNVVEQLIGPDIMGHPVWNLRTKTPNNEATIVPWHQDSAYLDTRAYGVLQPTAWIPLLDANKINGCMEVAKGDHLKGKVAKHQCCWGGTWYVQLEEEKMVDTLGIDMEKDVKLCCVPYGGMLLINNLILHRSLPNLSDQIRWSLDLRWQRPDLPVGFYDLKDGVLMRTKENPDMKISWESFDKLDRHILSQKAVSGQGFPEVEDSQFDTTIQGPWMRKWELVHMNRHTDVLSEDRLTWTKN